MKSSHSLLFGIFTSLLLLGACAHKSESASIISEKSAVVEGVQNFGEAMPAEPSVQPLGAIASKLPEYTGKAVKLSGRVGKVCQAKGCWMMLTDGEEAIRVKFGDHGFFVPLDLQGEAVVYGELQAIEMTLDVSKHMAEDAGVDPASVTEPQKEYRLVATALAVNAIAQ